MGLIEETIAAIKPLDPDAAAAAKARLDSLTKPLGSLGDLEEMVQRYAAIRRDPTAAFDRGALAVFVADHGVAEVGVSAYPKAVTVEMLRNIAAGGAAISILARHHGFDLIVTDVGVETDTSGTLAGVCYRRVGPGTRNFLAGPAMSLNQAREAIEIGINTVRLAVSRGATLIGLGELGIANSTSAAAILSAITGIEPARLAGRGTGIGDEAMRRKVRVIEDALKLHRPDLRDGLGTLASVGGFEIAAMVGACLAGAAAAVPVVVDGFIATASAIAADRIRPGLRDYLFFGHCSAEGGHALALEAFGVHPILQLNMRLGEGTGAALAMSVIRGALALFHQMATFDNAGVSGPIE